MIMRTMPQTGDNNDVSVIISKQATYLFPVMTVIIAARFPAALSLYWVVGTVADWFMQHHSHKRYTNRTTQRVTVSVRSKKDRLEAK
jgi:membrane protein insertase Oxa1/YidC/SpoIIIJ